MSLRVDVVDASRTDLLPRMPWHSPRRRRVTSAELPVLLRRARTRGVSGPLTLAFDCRRLSLAAALDIADQLRRCRDAGISTHAFASRLDLSTLVAVAPASVRCAPPLAGPVRPSISRTHLHLGKLLDRIGRPIEIVATGPLKAAANIASQAGVPADIVRNEREVFGHIVGVALATLACELGEGADALARASSTGLSAVDAADAGLLTHVGYQIDPATLVAPPTPAEQSGRLQQATQRPALSRDSRGPSVAVVDLRGPLVDPPLARHRLARRLAATVRDRRVRAVVLRVHSSGGDVELADRLWTQVRILTQHVPVVAHLLVATSAALHVAAAATAIVASPCALLGSLGAVTFALDLDPLLARLGIERSRLEYGSNDGPETTTPPAPGDLARQRVEIARALTVSRIATGRRLSRAAVAAIADGRLLSTVDARHHGLCDSVGTFEDALAVAADLAGLPEGFAVRML